MTWVWLSLFFTLIGAGYWLYRKGRGSAKADQMEGILDDLEESQKNKRDVDDLSRADLLRELSKRDPE